MKRKNWDMDIIKDDHLCKDGQVKRITVREWQTYPLLIWPNGSPFKLDHNEEGHSVAQECRNCPCCKSTLMIETLLG